MIAARGSTSASTTELDRANRRLQSLLEFARAVSSIQDAPDLLALIPREVVERTSCDASAVLLYDERRGAGAGAAWGLAPGFLTAWQEATRAAWQDQEERLPGRDGWETELGSAFGSRDAHVAVDVADDPRLAAVRPVLAAVGVRSAVVLPLVARGELLGVLAIYERHRFDPDPDGLSFMLALAEQAAVAIQNVRIYAQVRLDLRRRDALRRLVASFSSELDLDALLHHVAASAVELLDATSGSISLVDPGGGCRIRAVHNLRADLVGVDVSQGLGITGQVLRTRSPVVVEEYSRDLPHPIPGLDDLHAGIAVPVWRQGRLTGVFAVFDANPSREFSEQDREMVELLATHVAVAIENARLYGELQERLEETVSLQRLGALLLEEHDFDRVLDAICQQLLQLTDATGVGLALLDESNQFLELRTVVGPSAEALRGARIPYAGSFAGEALRTNQPQRSDDPANDPRGYRPSLVLGNTRSILSVPMKTRQRPVGVLSIYNKRGEGRSFTDRDADLATLFANQAAVAIENARLYEQTREYAVVEERNRLARDLHDSVTQSLFSVTLLAQAAISLWDRDQAKARERLERAFELAQGALAEMRALIFQLRPMALQEEGLLSALKKHVTAIKAREGLDATLAVEGVERRLPPAVEEAAFRIVQESLNNVVKHARAGKVVVRVTFEVEWLTVCTEDNGVGFNPAARPKHGSRSMGMTSMRERAEAVGGYMRVESEPGKGARVLAELPAPSGPFDKEPT